MPGLASSPTCSIMLGSLLFLAETIILSIYNTTLISKFPYKSLILIGQFLCQIYSMVVQSIQGYCTAVLYQ